MMAGYSNIRLMPLACFSLWLTLVIVLPVQARAEGGRELRSQYATVLYDSPELLQEFNENLQLGRQLGYVLQMRKAITREDELRAKLDIVINKAQEVLDMRPQNLRFFIKLFPDEKGVREEYKRNYHQEVNYLAYYSLSRKTMYLSVNRVSLRVFAHEVGHVIVDHFFPVRPPYKIHELMAQYVETHITD
ncbi:MAG: hypothetical protein BWK76_12685 [Desulfobulbaceae bacterium A2]|nr:MAG: hypothetical protein BWK76_12685 [Desulfobulbaceae bacterium A2]